MKDDTMSGLVLLFIAALIAYGWWTGQLNTFLAKLQAMIKSGPVAASSPGPVAAGNPGVGRGDSLIDIGSYFGDRRVGGIAN